MERPLKLRVQILVFHALHQYHDAQERGEASEQPEHQYDAVDDCFIHVCFTSTVLFGVSHIYNLLIVDTQNIYTTL